MKDAYIVVESIMVEDLVKQVNELIKLGYVPLAGITIGERVLAIGSRPAYFQAMTLTKPDTP